MLLASPGFSAFVLDPKKALRNEMVGAALRTVALEAGRGNRNRRE